MIDYMFPARFAVPVVRRQRPGDRKLHAPERRRPKRIAKKLRKRYSAQHYRDAATCFEMHVKQAARHGKLERELLALQRHAHDDQLDAIMLYGDKLYSNAFLSRFGIA